MEPIHSIEFGKNLNYICSSDELSYLLFAISKFISNSKRKLHTRDVCYIPIDAFSIQNFKNTPAISQNFFYIIL